MQKILTLAADWQTLSLLKTFFKKEQFLLYSAQSIKRAEQILKKENFELFLSERKLVDGDVLPLLVKIKAKKIFMKILVFSDQKSLQDRIAILKLADDFIAKPFNNYEFSLKIKNLLALDKKIEARILADERFLLKDSLLGDSSHGFFRSQELRILECFYKHKNLLVSYETISAYVWGYREPLPIKKTINVYVRRIRAKLNSRYRIDTVKNRGYRFIDVIGK